MRPEKIKVGIVGLGLVSASHYKGYAGHPGAEVTAVCDLEGERAERFASAFGIPQVYTSYDEMLEKAHIDVVDIATPTFLHVPMTVKAARAGKHIHCEKPFCRSVGEGLTACQAVRESGVKLVVSESYVFITSRMKARQLIEAGEIGRPLQVRQRLGPWIERERPVAHIRPAERTWRLDAEKSGGGEYPWIFDHVVHFFATAEYLMPGEVVSEVYAVTSTVHGTARAGARHDPYSTAAIDIPIYTWKYENPDCQGLWARAERLNGKYDYMRGFSTTIIGDRGVIEVLGEGGHNLLWDGRQQHLILHRESKEPVCFRFDEGGDDVWDSDICYYSQGHISSTRHLIDCIRQDTQPRYSGEDGVHAVQCALAVILSAQRGRPVRIGEVDPDYTAYAK
ncbi:MAG: Gfo/Idh/MocA family oxidoreductase [Actinobacteria bacterium]|nr:Gfo/Idh/MocA family oxidoreductase [Actinomycetota bacterium]MCL5026469.1 Gfo/Idh/MocA family oxidoreductase [Chloroflexota bacterium]